MIDILLLVLYNTKVNTFDGLYQNMLSDIMTKGIREKSERTDHEVSALPGLSFSIDISKDGFPLLSLRQIPIRVFVAEQVWFLMGSRKPEDFLRNFTKIWDDFTNPNDVVTVAYGYRYRKHFGRDQIALLIDLLAKEPSSRHGVVVAWDPGGDGLSLFKKKNVPCPYTFTVNIIGGKLHLHNIVRSNDMILGFPHDVAGFALLQCILAQKLGVLPGIYTHSISNAHVYDIHYAAAEEMIKRKTDQEKVTVHLPPHSFERAEKGDVEFVKEVVDDLTAQYKPGPAIRGLTIVP